MKNFVKDNKEYVKSISLVLIIQAIVYFIINLSLTKYHFLGTNLNVPFIKYFIYIYHSWYPFVFFLSYLIFKDNKDIIILDKTNNTKGLYTYNTFLLAGDTLWYKPVTLVDKLYNYPMQNDSRFILSELSKKDKIQKLHNDSISWYNNLPNNIDLMITHVPPFRNKSNIRGNNSCYYTEVKEYKSPVWIYGHDHKEEDIIINNTRLVSNPWGYDTKEFKIKTLTLTK